MPRKSDARAVRPDAPEDSLARVGQKEGEKIWPNQELSSPNPSKRPRVDDSTNADIQDVSDHELDSGRTKRTKSSEGEDGNKNDNQKPVKPAEIKSSREPNTSQRSSSRVRKPPEQFQPEMKKPASTKLPKKAESKATAQPETPVSSSPQRTNNDTSQSAAAAPTGQSSSSSFTDDIEGEFLFCRQEDKEHLAPLNIQAGEQFYFCKDPSEADDEIRVLVCIHCGRPRRLKDHKDLIQNYHQVRKHLVVCKSTSPELKKAMQQPIGGMKTFWGFLRERWEKDFCILKEGFEPPPQPKTSRAPKQEKSSKGKGKKAGKKRSYEGSHADRWDFIQNGKVPLQKMYRVIKESTNDEIHRAFRDVPSRKTRVQKIVRVADERIAEGTPEDMVIQLMELERGTKSIYSFADDVNNFQITPALKESFVKKKDRGPKIMVESDPSLDEYIEETGFLYHDSKSTQDCKELNLNEEPVDELSPIPRTTFNPMKGIPEGTSIKWSYDQDKRVLLANFKDIPLNEEVSDLDLKLFAHFMERDDITLISEGLFDTQQFISELWDLEAIRAVTGKRVHHKLKRFAPSTSNPALFDEIDMLEGPLETFLDYVHKHMQGEQGFISLKHTEKEGGLVEVDTAKDVVYAIDIDLPRLLPRNHRDFQRNFRMKQIMPGGEWCMMSHLPASARPFMGPNMYITPGGSYTHLHQDGNGTVDSGHCVLSGYNEVVMLRRLTERHKENACKMLPNRGEYDALYTFPHEGGPKPDWPSKDTINSWEMMGYAPSVFILKPGQHVHINKGRLHCFRKVTKLPLPVPDCHHDLRKELLDNGVSIPLCVSVAWDWQYLGVSPEGINREVASSLECQNLIDTKQNRRCLAIPRACLLQMGKSLFFMRDALKTRNDSVSSIGSPRTGVWKKDAILCGINPSLQYILEENIESIKRYDSSGGRGKKHLSKADRNDTEQQLSDAGVDPDGNDYFCRICNRELENIYLHCDGCENLLQKDFNICTSCFENSDCQKDHDMCGRGFEDPRINFRKTTSNHVICFPDEPCGCDAEERQICFLCKDCTGCSCTCHSDYTVRRRFYDLDQLEKLQQLSSDFESDEAMKIEHGHLTKPRLVISRDRAVAGMDEKRKLLADHKNNKREAKEHEMRKVVEEENHRKELELSLKSTSTSLVEEEKSQSADLIDKGVEETHATVETGPEGNEQGPHTHSTCLPSDRVSSESEDSPEPVGGATSSTDGEGEISKIDNQMVGEEDGDETPPGEIAGNPVPIPEG